MNTIINDLIKEYKEYQDLQEQLKSQMDELKEQIVKIMVASSLDEYNCQQGKVTYREVLSTRFQSTEFKKIHGDLYKAYIKPTSSMRFTCN